MLHIIAILITLAAAFSYLNFRFLKLPATIGLMGMSLTVSLAVLAAGAITPGVRDSARELVQQVDFHKVLMKGMLGLLLFAGALHVNLDDLMAHKWGIGIFATLGVLVSTGLVAAMTYLVSAWLGLGLRVIHCLLFGALISPTDPIAVLGLLKKLGAPRSLRTRIAGESLFNDGIGVVVFIAVAEIAAGGHGATPGGLALLFAVEALGGVAFGLAAGYVAYRLLSSIDNHQVEVLLTLALVVGGYALADAVHTSGPLAMVVAGLLIGNHGRRLAMSERTRENLDTFWELIDSILNALLFVLIGLEVVVVSLRGEYLLAGAMAIPLVLLARLVSVGVPVALLRRRRAFAPGAIRIMTWGGLRGGISVALALSLRAELVGHGEVAVREVILTMTYAVVAFAILVQGMTVRKLVKAPEPQR